MGRRSMFLMLVWNAAGLSALSFGCRLNSVPDSPNPRGAAAEQAPPAAVPAVVESLDPYDVMAGMAIVRRGVAVCYAKFQVPGVAITSSTINQGRVTAATVIGQFAGTPTAACVEDALRKATFKRAKQPVTVQYPFILR